MWLPLSDDFVVHQGLLSQDISQVAISPVCHDGFVLERLPHLLVDVEDGPVLVYRFLQVREVWEVGHYIRDSLWRISFFGGVFQ